MVFLHTTLPWYHLLGVCILQKKYTNAETTKTYKKPFCLETLGNIYHVRYNFMALDISRYFGDKRIQMRIVHRNLSSPTCKKLKNGKYFFLSLLTTVFILQQSYGNNKNTIFGVIKVNIKYKYKSIYRYFAL